jgi:hypothetical protein
MLSVQERRNNIGGGGYRLNGNRKIFPISLNTTSSVKPTILNGRSISQSSGKKIIMSNASGQQMTSSKHHRARAINVFIVDLPGAKEIPIEKMFVSLSLRVFEDHHNTNANTIVIKSVQLF